MQLPETTIASQSFLKTGFRNASQVEVFSAVFSIGGIVELELFTFRSYAKQLEKGRQKIGNSHMEMGRERKCSIWLTSPSRCPQLPALVEDRLFWAVHSEPRKPALPGWGVNPVRSWPAGGFGPM